MWGTTCEAPSPTHSKIENSSTFFISDTRAPLPAKLRGPAPGHATLDPAACEPREMRRDSI